jgi:outer membrane protein OmpA-like peptidoglycan-associated protein
MKNVTKSLKYLSLMGLLYFASFIVANAQIRDYDAKFGVQFNGVQGLTEFYESESFKPGYIGRAFFRFELADEIEAEVGGGYGILQGKDFSENYYQTELIPIDLRFLIRPFDMESFNPYLYAGIGALKYKVKDLPVDQRPDNVEGDDWTGIVPVGIGFEFGLSESVILDLSGGVTYSFSDDLNYFSRGAKDAYASVGLGLTFVSGAGSSDKDMDGLTKSEEKVYGTNPDLADTDGDGVNDGDEVYSLKTNPLKSDTDGDGLSDSDEVNKYSTNPVKADSDDDGLSDGDEINKYSTEPTQKDSDKDGLDDNEEINKYKTNPTNKDSDKDRLFDGDEVLKYKTDPNKSDTDGDGLTDGDEVLKYKTNPLSSDTDMGTVSDNIEVKRGTDPLNADDDVVKVDVPMVLEGVTFASGKSDITPESALILEQALKTLTTYDDIIVEIRGYTDNVGRKSSNIKLSQKRADSVRNWLIEKGIDGSRVRSVGFGPQNPIVSNDTPDNRRKNRRIEFVRTK